MGLVAVTCDRRIGLPGDGTNLRPARREVWVSEHTVEHLRAVGLTPILLPPGGTELDRVLRVVQGVVISGGAFDIHPAHYGQQVTGRLDRIDEARTGLELALVRECARRGMPLLGLCGGMQAMVVALGGALLQHIEGHEQFDDPTRADHPLRTAEGYSWLGKSVNSTHHQAADPANLGQARPVAWAGEVVEAVVSERMLGVQWHPELLDQPGGSGVFSKFASWVR